MLEKCNRLSEGRATYGTSAPLQDLREMYGPRPERVREGVKGVAPRPLEEPALGE